MNYINKIVLKEGLKWKVQKKIWRKIKIVTLIWKSFSELEKGNEMGAKERYLEKFESSIFKSKDWK